MISEHTLLFVSIIRKSKHERQENFIYLEPFQSQKHWVWRSKVIINLDTEVRVSICSSIRQTTSWGWAVTVATRTWTSCCATFSIIAISSGTSFAFSGCLTCISWAFWTWVWIAWRCWRLSCWWIWIRVLLISPTCSWCILNSVDTWILRSQLMCVVFKVFFL